MQKLESHRPQPSSRAYSVDSSIRRNRWYTLYNVVLLRRKDMNRSSNVVDSDAVEAYRRLMRVVRSDGPVTVRLDDRDVRLLTLWQRVEKARRIVFRLALALFAGASGIAAGIGLMQLH